MQGSRLSETATLLFTLVAHTHARLLPVAGHESTIPSESTRSAAAVHWLGVDPLKCPRKPLLHSELLDDLVQGLAALSGRQPLQNVLYERRITEVDGVHPPMACFVVQPGAMIAASPMGLANFSPI